MAGLIDDYIASLKKELDFDPALANRLASEVEDHLREAAEADTGWPSFNAESRAVERFGPAHTIAVQFAADAVDRQARRTWVTLLVTVTVTLVAMRLRVIWFDTDASTLAPLVDRYGFLAAVGAAGIGWCADRRSLLPLAFCVAGLATSIVAGFVRTELFTVSAPLPLLLPALCETALMVLLTFNVAGLGRRLARAAALQRADR